MAETHIWTHYLDGSHDAEKVDWILVEVGTAATIVCAGIIQVNNSSSRSCIICGIFVGGKFAYGRTDELMEWKVLVLVGICFI